MSPQLFLGQGWPMLWWWWTQGIQAPGLPLVPLPQNLTVAASAQESCRPSIGLFLQFLFLPHTILNRTAEFETQHTSCVWWLSRCSTAWAHGTRYSSEVQTQPQSAVVTSQPGEIRPQQQDLRQLQGRLNLLQP